MTKLRNTSLPASAKSVHLPSRRVNWHEAAVCAVHFHYPRELIKHLHKNSLFCIEKYSAGIYYINNETFRIQIIVTPGLSPEENLYLYCLTNHLEDASTVDRFAEDYTKHQHQEVYNKYLYQLSNANPKTKGESSMVNEWLFNRFGTSSDEIFARGKQESEDYYLPRLNELTKANEQLSSQVDRLKELLRKNNISYE